MEKQIDKLWMYEELVWCYSFQYNELITREVLDRLQEITENETN